MISSNLDQLMDILPKGANTVIGVEGASTSGKTTLARKLGAALGSHVLSTDDFYRTGFLGATYTEGLRLPDLRQQWTDLAGVASPLIVEGICLRETLESLGTNASFYIYTKRISPAGLWHDDPALFDGSSIDSGSTQERIDTWSHEYHLRKAPHLIADAIFEWSTDAS